MNKVIPATVFALVLGLGGYANAEPLDGLSAQPSGDNGLLVLTHGGGGGHMGGGHMGEGRMGEGRMGEGHMMGGDHMGGRHMASGDHMHGHYDHYGRNVFVLGALGYGNEWGYDGYGYYGDCGWLRHRAAITGSRYWWRRYQACLY